MTKPPKKRFSLEWVFKLLHFLFKSQNEQAELHSRRHGQIRNNDQKTKLTRGFLPLLEPCFTACWVGSHFTSS